MLRRYLVVIEKGENSYGAYAPDVPGCVSVSKTIEETLRNFQEAIEFHFESMIRDGDPIPESAHVEAHLVEVEVPDTIPARS
jgi:predicted RNase H-like HicB family nuclease